MNWPIAVTVCTISVCLTVIYIVHSYLFPVKLWLASKIDEARASQARINENLDYLHKTRKPVERK